LIVWAGVTRRQEFLQGLKPTLLGGTPGLKPRPLKENRIREAQESSKTAPLPSKGAAPGQFIDHLTDDVLPPLIDKLSTEGNRDSTKKK
jgi:hypothetical protein